MRGSRADRRAGPSLRPAARQAGGLDSPLPQQQRPLSPPHPRPSLHPAPRPAHTSPVAPRQPPSSPLPCFDQSSSTTSASFTTRQGTSRLLGKSSKRFGTRVSVVCCLAWEESEPLTLPGIPCMLPYTPPPDNMTRGMHACGRPAPAAARPAPPALPRPGLGLTPLRPPPTQAAAPRPPHTPPPRLRHRTPAALRQPRGRAPDARRDHNRVPG